MELKKIKLDKDFKRYLKNDIISLLHVLGNDEELNFNDVAGIISTLRTTQSSLEIKCKKLVKLKDDIKP